MRYKEFNNNRVLEDTITLFWNHGFGACTISDIVTKTNVNRFSLYQEFDNKEGILYAALDLYKERYFKKQLQLLASKKPSKEAIKEFFLSYLSDNNTHPSGCFILHISTELADSNSAINNSLNGYLKEIEQHFIAVLNAGDFSKDESKFIAKHLIGLFCTSMCFCVIHSYKERVSLVENGLNMLFTKSKNYA